MATVNRRAAGGNMTGAGIDDRADRHAARIDVNLATAADGRRARRTAHVLGAARKDKRACRDTGTADVLVPPWLTVTPLAVPATP